MALLRSSGCAFAAASLTVDKSEGLSDLPLVAEDVEMDLPLTAFTVADDFECEVTSAVGVKPQEPEWEVLVVGMEGCS